MKIKEYIYANSLSEAIHQITDTQKTSQIISGGALIASQLRSGYLDCDQLVDISRIAELKAVAEVSSNGYTYLQLGAGLSLSSVEKLAIVAEKYPLLQKALRESSDPARRNAYTLGGSIAARLPKGMLLPVLCALNSQIVFLTRYSERSIPIINWFASPMQEKMGIITAILIPQQKVNSWVIKDVKRRNHPGEIVVGALTALTQFERQPDPQVQIFGSVDTYGLVDFSAIASSLDGKNLTNTVLEEAEVQVKAMLKNQWGLEEDAAYRIRVLGTLVKRCLKELNGNSGESI